MLVYQRVMARNPGYHRALGFLFPIDRIESSNPALTLMQKLFNWGFHCTLHRLKSLQISSTCEACTLEALQRWLSKQLQDQVPFGGDPLVFSMAFSAPADRQTMADLSSKLGNIDCECGKLSLVFIWFWGTEQV
jgi:hypothetical protein